MNINTHTIEKLKYSLIHDTRLENPQVMILLMQHPHKLGYVGTENLEKLSVVWRQQNNRRMQTGEKK